MPSDDKTEVQASRRRASADPKGEFPFDVTDYVPHLIAAINQFRDSALDGALRKLGLNVGRYRVMGVLSRFGVCTMTELAHFTAIDRTTLTRIADHLVASGYVERRSDAKDRRQVRLELTAEGAQVHRQALFLVFDLNGRLLENVPDEEGRVAARVLRDIVRNLAPNQSARDSIIYYNREALKDGGSKS
jgi:DNA-binding MarR family transcriptional regulator